MKLTKKQKIQWIMRDLRRCFYEIKQYENIVDLHKKE